MSRSGATTGSKQLTSVAGEFPPITPIVGSRLAANHVIELSVSNVRFREKSDHGLLRCILHDAIAGILRQMQTGWESR